MKLYTEEQMRECYGGVLQNVGTCIKQSDLPTTDEYIDSLTPIELPSDEEIEQDMIHQSGEYACGWEDAFRWLKEQILNQNKQL